MACPELAGVASNPGSRGCTRAGAKHGKTDAAKLEGDF